MYGAAETLAARVPRQEEYIGRVPAIAIAPWFLAGSLFPISAMPQGLEDIAKVLPLTHGLALMRYGLLGQTTGLRNIWGMTNVTEMAALSLAVVALFAAALTAISIRVFTRSAVRRRGPRCRRVTGRSRETRCARRCSAPTTAWSRT
jgi:hypothetical protein